MDIYEMVEAAADDASELPTMVVNRQTYCVDSQRRELRNVLDPTDRFVFCR